MNKVLIVYYKLISPSYWNIPNKEKFKIKLNLCPAKLRASLIGLTGLIPTICIISTFRGLATLLASIKEVSVQTIVVNLLWTPYLCLMSQNEIYGISKSNKNISLSKGGTWKVTIHTRRLTNTYSRIGSARLLVSKQEVSLMKCIWN